MLRMKKIKPMFTRLITTADVFDKDDIKNGIIVNPAGTIKPYQKVLAIGSGVRDINVGDTVMINPSAYIKKKYNDNSIREDIVDNPTISVDIPMLELDDKKCFMVDMRDIEYVLEDFEEKDEVITLVDTPVIS